eukprot:TRINITY_DN48239_c0_g1_i1.p1 TRINITY_DN48239_c0_g1~~TRINITY_DN48239_c0_g1_i1.p1  ORF type:complete len:400 (+),score=76.54 TRINITY_DN48239_c0_g1_i1:87-1202(+)
MSTAGLGFDDVEALLEDAARDPASERRSSHKDSSRGNGSEKDRKRRKESVASRSRSREREPKRDHRERDRDRRGGAGDRQAAPERDPVRERLEREAEQERAKQKALEEERQNALDEMTRGDRTVMVAALPSKCDERDLYEFFTGAGNKVRDVQIIRDARTGRSKGVGYIEFFNQEFAMKALSLNGHPLKGQTLCIQPSHAERNRYGTLGDGPTVGSSMTITSVGTGNPPSLPALPPAPLGEPARKMADASMSGAAPPSSSQRPLAEDIGMPSLYVALQGVFARSEVDLKADPNFYQELEEEVGEECQKYGRPKGVHASRLKSPDCGTVWIRFGSVSAAMECRAALHKRWFGGKQIVARFATEAQYKAAGGN